MKQTPADSTSTERSPSPPSSITLGPSTILREIVLQVPGAARAMERFHIDYCCGGAKSLGEACAQVAQPLAAVLAAIEEERQKGGDSDAELLSIPLARLVEHLVSVHHARTRTDAARLSALAVVARAEAEAPRHHRALDRVAPFFTSLLSHLDREEAVVFPYVVELERRGVGALPPPAELGAPLAVILASLEHEHEHDEAGAAELRELLGGAQEGTALDALAQGLADHERDLQRHMHLEANVLFPRTIRLEQKVRSVGHGRPAAAPSATSIPEAREENAMTETARTTLASILAPIEPAEFFERYWEKKPLLVQREDRRYYGDLLTMRSLDRVLTSHTLTQSNAFIANAKSPTQPDAFTFPDGTVDVARLYQLFADGGTIGFNQLHTFMPRLHDLCRSLERELSCRFQTNIYMTPPGSQGFPAHYDSHDVFILQVHGTKHWTIFDTPIALPFRGQPFQRETTPVGAVTMELDLRPGDMFYLPRGIMHAAETREGETLHITVGALQTTWTELLIEAVANVALRTPEMRRSLPPGYARTEYDRTEARATFAKLLAAVAAQADPDSAFDHFADDLVSTRTALLEGQLEQILSLPSLSVDDRAGARPNVLYRERTEDGKIVVSFHGAEMHLPLHAAAALRYALETPEFRVRDLPGDLDDAGKVVLVKRLVREGVVRRLA